MDREVMTAFVGSSGKPVQGYTITWASSDTTVATVSSAGQVTARGAGTATTRRSTGVPIASRLGTVGRPSSVDAWRLTTCRSPV